MFEDIKEPSQNPKIRHLHRNMLTSPAEGSYTKVVYMCREGGKMGKGLWERSLMENGGLSELPLTGR